MAHASDAVLATLREMGIEAETRAHPPVLTVDEMMAVCGDLPGAHTKNLFLRDAKKTCFLVSMLHDAVLDLKSLRSLIGARGNLSFASAETLSDRLGVVSGAVSPLAIVNDREGVVRVCLQDELVRRPLVNFHPLSNDRTTALAAQDLLRFLDAVGHSPLIFSLAGGQVTVTPAG